MLTCRDVEDLLPGIAAGEESDEPVREHVAACAACRASRERLAAEVGRLREGLTSLSPSPFLEDVVARAAREGRQPARGSRRSLWLGAGLALAAAALLVAVLPRDPAPKGAGDGQETAKGDGKSFAAIRIPPSADEVAAARAKNRVSLDKPEDLKRAMLHESAGERHYVSETFVPPWEGVAQRWVYGDTDAQFGARTFSIGFPPRDGVMSLGNELMALLHAVVHVDPDDGVTMTVGEKRWGAAGGGNEAELFLGSPDGSPGSGGAEARVRVVIATGYSGTLLLEGPIARALDLHQFEIPGGFRVGGGLEITGQRARARVRIPELGVDRVVEVQVRDDATAAPSPTTLRGARPSSFVFADGVDLRDDGTLTFRGAVVHTAPATTSVRIEIPPGQVFMAGGEGGGLVFRRFGERADAPPGDLAFETMTLKGKVEPLAPFLIARAWRGQAAIPTREPVIVGRSEADGTVRFVRSPGEAGGSLQALVRRKDGSSELLEVTLEREDEFRVEIALGPDAIRVLYVDIVHDFRWGEAEVLPLSDASEAGKAAVLERLKATLARIAKEAGDPRRLPRGRMVLTCEADTPWTWVASVLQLGASPSFGFRRVTYVPAWGGESIEQDLPEDGDLLPSTHAPDRIVRLTLLRREGETETGVRFGDMVILGGLANRADILHEVRGRAPGPDTVGRISYSPPNGGVGIPFRDVLAAMRLLREGGVREIVFEAPPPR